MAILLNRLKQIWNDYPIAFGCTVYAIVGAIYAISTNGMMRDDAYIFLQYARDLADTGILAFNPGRESYGVTSIVWTVLIALFSYLPISMITVSKSLGVILSTLGIGFWAHWSFNRAKIQPTAIPIICAALIPTIGPGRMVVGMEPPLLLFLSGLLLYAYGRNSAIGMGIIGGILVLARPDMAVVIMIIAILLLFRKRLKTAIIFGILTFCIAFPWHLWLFNRTGHFLPPTRIGKLAVFLPVHLNITYPQFEAGSLIDRAVWAVIALKNFSFLAGSSVVFLAVLLFAIAVLLIAVWRKTTFKRDVLFVPIIIAIVLVVTYCAMFPLLKLRYFVWLTPGLVIGVWFTFNSLLPSKWFSKLSLIAIILLLIVAVPALQRRIHSTEMTKYRRVVGQWLEQNTAPDARIALEPIGEIGFNANRYIIDMGGLTDLNIQQYIIDGYKDTDRILQCLSDYRADYLIMYDHEKFLGAVVETHPEKFERIVYIPEHPVENQRYCIVKVLK